MDSQTATALISAAAGLGVATIGAIVKGGLAQRAGLDESLRDARTKLYPTAWHGTGAISLWPKADLTWGDLRTLQHDLRDWYFGGERPVGSAYDGPAGLYLSTNAQLRYREMQHLIGLWLQAAKHEHELVPDEVYEALRNECSAFRTALTEDLETRRKRSVWWAIQTRRLHHKQKREAATRVRAAPAPRPESHEPPEFISERRDL